MKIFLNLCLVLFLLLPLHACKTTNLATIKQAKDEPEICAKLRRQIQFNKRDHNVGASWSTRAQQERLQQLYRENNCQ